MNLPITLLRTNKDPKKYVSLEIIKSPTQPILQSKGTKWESETN